MGDNEKMRTFSVVQPYVDLDDDRHFLPTDEQIREWEKRRAALVPELDGLQSQIDATKGKKSEEKALLVAKFARAKAEADSLDDAIAGSARVRQKCEGKIKTFTFEIHRYGYNEKLSAQDDATTVVDYVPMVNRGEFVVNLLASCIERWDYVPVGEEKVADLSREAVQNLEPKLVEVLYNVLLAKSEPSGDRLNFLAS